MLYGHEHNSIVESGVWSLRSGISSLEPVVYNLRSAVQGLESGVWLQGLASGIWGLESRGLESVVWGRKSVSGVWGPHLWPLERVRTRRYLYRATGCSHKITRTPTGKLVGQLFSKYIMNIILTVYKSREFQHAAGLWRQKITKCYHLFLKFAWLLAKGVLDSYFGFNISCLSRWTLMHSPIQACWCETNDKEKTKSIADAESRIAGKYFSFKTCRGNKIRKYLYEFGRGLFHLSVYR